ncbi:hypothetical protein [Hydrogenimonas cancrithermarum]|uniref:Uncharacterized protein n=1 Tax=Hydrogenimonas cancrithermarum TaxID=2993563 RepID=A0ABN6WSK1_9BACT|nr:hypothetical protein [Hydrogenimonas cancrithermarum]BDY11937.1 hypothetical protein HCR_02490 [Hydrogenimonas cancrithermarum]
MEAIIWYAVWPVVIYVSWKFVMRNIDHSTKMERLEALEKRYGA